MKEDNQYRMMFSVIFSASIVCTFISMWQIVVTMNFLWGLVIFGSAFGMIIGLMGITADWAKYVKNVKQTRLDCFETLLQSNESVKDVIKP